MEDASEDFGHAGCREMAAWVLLGVVLSIFKLLGG